MITLFLRKNDFYLVHQLGSMYCYKRTKRWSYGWLMAQVLPRRRARRVGWYS